jgi:hypothetical protein
VFDDEHPKDVVEDKYRCLYSSCCEECDSHEPHVEWKCLDCELWIKEGCCCAECANWHCECELCHYGDSEECEKCGKLQDKDVDENAYECDSESKSESESE